MPARRRVIALLEGRTLLGHDANPGRHVFAHDLGERLHRLLGVQRIAHEVEGADLALLGLVGQGSIGTWCRRGREDCGPIMLGLALFWTIGSRRRVLCLHLMHGVAALGAGWWVLCGGAGHYAAAREKEERQGGRAERFAGNR